MWVQFRNILFSIAGIIPLISSAQSISGVINSYTAVTAINCNQITVASSSSFNPGDYVLVIQMQGVTIDQTNTSTFGDITDYKDAGNWEFAIVSSISGNVITLTAPLMKTYDPAFPVQMIAVPHYTDVTISASLSCNAWDGSTGGVLVFMADGTVTMNDDINVSGKGFRAGTTCIGGFGCGFTNYYLDNTLCSGGKKGESVSIPTANMYTGGRGKNANGGGGGNPGNCGGGGGANYGAGGDGGYEYSGCFNTIQGIGGAALDYSLGKIFMGGAGGTGFDDNGQPIFAGQSGGAIVIIIANTIVTNNHSIISNGTDVTGITNDESAGGGGAGGTVCLDIQNFTGTLNVTTKGGKGGNTLNFIFTTDCHGPGGGGGGGAVWVSQSSLPVDIVFDGTPGSPGLVLTGTSPCFNNSDGALTGIVGAPVFDFPGLIINTPVTIDLGPDSSICPTSSLVLHAGADFASYLWQDGSTDSLFTVIDSGMYFVQVTDTNGCTLKDTVNIALYPPLQLASLTDTIFCPGETVLLVESGSDHYTYQWQDGSTDSTFIASLPGTYWVKVTDTSGCFGYDTAMIANYVYPLLNIGNDTSICPRTSVLFSAGFFSSYVWQDGSTLPNFLADSIGEYFVTATDSNGCIQKDTAALISFYPEPQPNLVSDTVVCPNVPELLTAPDGFAAYEWNDGSTSQTLEIDQPGIYWVKLTNAFTCPNTDTIVAKEECPTGIYIPNAFSPNSDGINDLFTAIGYNVTEFHMTIFNRWGELIFQSGNMTDGWNGKFEGKDCEIGVYVYQISYAGELNGITSSGTYKGNVTLLR